MNLKDIARLAGVSHTTVSRVINKADGVSPEIRERVQNIINQYGFTLNYNAKALISGKTNVIGLILTYDFLEFSGEFLPPFLVGIMSELNHTEYSLNMYFTSMGGLLNAGVKQRLFYNQIDGALILNVNSDQNYTQMIAGIDKPKVVLNEKFKNLQLNSVVSDEEQGVYKAICYLIQTGHRRIGFVGVKKKYPSSSTVRERGYRKALEESGIPIDESLIGEGKEDSDCIRTVVADFLQTPSGIDAVFTCSELTAVMVISELQRHNRSVPQDISVVGFDDHRHSKYMNPALTTIRKDRTLMGKQGTQLLLDLIRNPEKQSLHTEITIPTELIIRNSAKERKID